MNTRISVSKRSIAVIGGGITGLVAAQALTEKGARVQVFEASSRPGGSIQTECTDGWLIEGGPNTILDGEACVRGLIEKLGLTGEVVSGSDGARKRFIVRDSRVQALPMSPPSLLTTKLFSWRTRLRIFSELFEKPRNRQEDVSLAELVGDHFGQEAVDYGLNPFVGGVYAGDPNLLSSMYSFPSLWKSECEKGSIIRGMMAAGKERKARGARRSKIISFRRGLQSLTDALAARLPADCLQLSSPVLALHRDGTGWRVEYARPAQPPATVAQEEFDQVVFALPAHALAKIRIDGEDGLRRFAEVVHPPVTSLFLGYKRSQVAHPLDGFGVLIPAIEKRRELGILFSSSLFPGRAPEGHVALTVMVGGMRQPELARKSAAEVRALVEPDLSELLGVVGEPVFQRYNHWPLAIPQYNLGYERCLEHYTALEKHHPSLFFGGNARDGIAVPNCIASGLRLAEAVFES